MLKQNCFPKNIDNTYYIPSVVIDDLNVQMATISQTLKYKGINQGVGNILQQVSADGTLNLNPIFGVRNIITGFDQLDGAFTASTVFNAVTLANALIPPPSSSNPVNIIIVSGTFETTAITLNDGVNLSGDIQGGLAFMTLVAPLGTWITISGNGGSSQLSNVPLNGLNLCDYIIDVLPGQVNSLCTNCIFTGQGTAPAVGACIRIQGGSDFTFNETFFITQNLSPIGGPNLTINTALLVEGGAKCICAAVVGFAANFDAIGFPELNGFPFNMYQVDAGAFAIINSTICQRLSTVFTSTGELLVQSAIFIGNDIVFDLSTPSITNFLGSYIADTITWDIRVNDTTSILNTQSTTFSFNKLSVPSTSQNISLQWFESDIDNSRGLHSTGNIVFGTHDSLPATIFLGQGGVESADTIILKFNVGTGLYTNVSANLKPSSQTNTTLYDNLTAGSIFYIGDNQPFGALRYQLTQLRTGGTVVNEYWNGVAWTAFTVMTTTDAPPYISTGNTIATASIGTLNTRFNNNILLTAGGWALTTVNSLSAYWIRSRITVNITQSPKMSLLTIFPSTSRFDSKGIVSHYGLNRVAKNITLDMGSLQGGAGNKTIYVSSILIVKKINNSFGLNDQSVGTLTIPQDCDTSTPIECTIYYVSNSPAAGQASFTMSITHATPTVGDLVSTAVPPALTVAATEKTQSITLALSAVNGQFIQAVNFKLDINDCIIRNSTTLNDKSFLVLSFIRTAGNPNLLNIVHVSIAYLSYLEGSIKT